MIAWQYPKNLPVTQGRLNRMCKYFKDKKVHIEYEYNNSIGWHDIREYTGKYDSFDIRTLEYSGGNNYCVRFINDGIVVFEHDFGPYAEFCGLGKISEINGGPYCWFTIKRK